MPRLLSRLLFVCLLFSAWPAPAQTVRLAPEAKRDLAVLATAYPGLITAIEVDRTGRATVVLNDGTRLPYDDGRAKSPEELLDHPDIKDMLAEPSFPPVRVTIT